MNDNEIRRVMSSVSSFDVHLTSSPGGVDFPYYHIFLVLMRVLPFECEWNKLS